jgi:hypothetical protein
LFFCFAATFICMFCIFITYFTSYRCHYKHNGFVECVYVDSIG